MAGEDAEVGDRDEQVYEGINIEHILILFGAPDRNRCNHWYFVNI